jgi:hypothetical protein
MHLRSRKLRWAQAERSTTRGTGPVVPALRFAVVYFENRKIASLTPILFFREARVSK